MAKSKYQCPVCKHFFSNKGGSYHRHCASCDGSYTSPGSKRTSCKYCNVDFQEELTASQRANHTRWCHDNPKRNTYVQSSRAATKAMQIAKKSSGYTNQYTKARIQGNPVPESRMKGNPEGKCIGKKHTTETKRLLREKALASPHRRLKKTTIMYNEVLLDSSWELELAKRLDELQIKWVRPGPIPWVDKDGVIHNYFADFYLEDYDLFLDPKNPHAIRVQKRKLDSLLTQYKNIIIIESLEKCKNYRP
jgi:hypothetical protein